MPTKKQHADDNLARSRMVRDPEMCVDYLSYRFDEMDLAASWRVMTKQKKEVVNGIRLENASWRTWAKHKYNLKTVSPETLNWLKDSDVTWLYGPLHTVIKNIEEEDRYAKRKVQSTEDTLGLMTHAPKTPTATTATPSSSSSAVTVTKIQAPSPPRPPLKSALKRVTTSDLLRRSATELPSLVSEASHEIVGSSQLPPPVLDSTTSPPTDTITEANKKLKVFSPSVVATHRQPKLRFNMCVEQCVALAVDDSLSPKHTRFVDFSGDDDNNDESDSLIGDDADSEDDIYSDDENAIVLDYDNLPRSSTIKKIAPARLKTSSQSEQETDDVSSLSSSQSSSFIRPQGRQNHDWTVGGDNGAEEEEVSSMEGEIDIRDNSTSTSTSNGHRRRLGEQSGASQVSGAFGGGDIGNSHVGSATINKNKNTNPQAIQWVGQTCVYNHQPSDFEEEDYGFDDGWDTQDDNEFPSPSLTPTVPTPASPPPISYLPPGQHNILGKAMPVNGPCRIDATEPSLSRGSPNRQSIVQMQRNVAGGASSSNNTNSGTNDNTSSFLGSFAQWASSYLWSSSSSSSSPKSASSSRQ